MHEHQGGYHDAYHAIRRGTVVAMVLLLALCLAMGNVPARAEPAVAPEPAPAFTLPGTAGEVSLAALRGQLVYVDFWASWCVPCRRSFPWMNELHARYAERGLHIVAINLDQDREAAAAFLAATEPRFTIAWDPAGDSAERFGVIGMPSSWLIDADGRIVDNHVGFRARDREALEARIVAALPPPLQAAREASR